MCRLAIRFGKVNWKWRKKTHNILYCRDIVDNIVDKHSNAIIEFSAVDIIIIIIMLFKWENTWNQQIEKNSRRAKKEIYSFRENDKPNEKQFLLLFFVVFCYCSSVIVGVFFMYNLNTIWISNYTICTLHSNVFWAHIRRWCITQAHRSANALSHVYYIWLVDLFK